MPLDETDKQILNAVLESGRATVREIAERTDHVAPTVSRRLDELANRGIIDGYVPLVSNDHIGYELTVVFQFGVTGEGLGRLTDALRAHERFVDVYEVTGPSDVVAIGTFHDSDAMHEQVGTLLADLDVTTVEVSGVREIIHEHRPFEIDADEA